MSRDSTDKRFEQMLYAYELNMLSESDCREFEAHLLECDSCFEQAARFEKASAHLTRDTELQNAVIAEEDLDKDRRDLPSVSSPKKIHSLKRWLPIAAALLIALLIVFRPWQIEIRPTDDAFASVPRLAVLYFENVADPDSPERLGEIVTSLLITDLGESRFVHVVSSQRLYDIAAGVSEDGVTAISRTTATQIAESARARWMITGEILQTSPRIEITSRIAELQTGAVVATQKVSGDEGEDIFDIVDRLTVAIKRDLALPEAALMEPDRKIADVTSRSPEAYRYFLEGVENITRVKNDAARLSFLRALEVDSTMAMAYYYLTLLGDWQQVLNAVKYIDHSSQKERYFIRHQESITLGDTAQARVWMKEAIEIYPGELKFHEILGFHDFHMGKFEEAIRSYEQVLAIDSANRGALNQLAYSYLATGDANRAIVTVEKYVAVALDEPNPYDTRGDIRASMGDLDGAITSYRVAIEKDSSFTTTLLSLPTMLIFRDDYEEAAAFAADLRAQADPARTSIALEIEALMAVRRGQFQDALSFLREGIRFDVSIRHRRAEGRKLWLKMMVLAHIGNADSALVTFDRVRVGYDSLVGPGQVTYYHHHGQMLAFHGYTTQAMHEASVLRDRLLGAVDGEFAYSYIMGCVKLVEGDALAAVEDFQIADSIRSSYFTRYLLARAYIASGQHQLAADILAGLMKSYNRHRLLVSTWDVTGHYYLGLAYENLGRSRDADSQYRRFLALWAETDHPIPEIDDARERLDRLTHSP